MSETLFLQGKTTTKEQTKKKTQQNKKKKKKRSGSKKKFTSEQVHASTIVHEWVFSGRQFCSGESSVVAGNDFAVVQTKSLKNVVFELHSHSICSDGFLTPTKVVERAHGNGVKVLALTDHDTMAGIPEALEAARRFGIRIIPGVEISTIFSPSGESGSDEPVHILAYYSSCGPTRFEELDKLLANIREGRYLRAKNIISKLNNLKLPLEWEHVARIAGTGVAPGRLHVARAMVEAGYVENLKQAFTRYLYDGGPAYSTGSEPLAEEAVKIISDTGGLAVLAHPWALKNPIGITRKLKEAGLHGIEVYRNDGKLEAYSDLADTYGLVKLGGSDYHAKGGRHESDLGSVHLPILAVHEFLKVARPIWCSAIKNILDSYAEDPSDMKLDQITRFGKTKVLKGGVPFSCGKDLIDLCLSSWLTSEEMQNAEFEAIKSKLTHNAIIRNGGMQVQVPIESM